MRGCEKCCIMFLILNYILLVDIPKEMSTTGIMGSVIRVGDAWESDYMIVGLKVEFSG